MKIEKSFTVNVTWLDAKDEDNIGWYCSSRPDLVSIIIHRFFEETELNYYFEYTCTYVFEKESEMNVALSNMQKLETALLRDYDLIRTFEGGVWDKDEEYFVHPSHIEKVNFLETYCKGLEKELGFKQRKGRLNDCLEND
jgi:hypothetical protein